MNMRVLPPSTRARTAGQQCPTILAPSITRAPSLTASILTRSAHCLQLFPPNEEEFHENSTQRNHSEPAKHLSLLPITTRWLAFLHLNRTRHHLELRLYTCSLCFSPCGRFQQP